MSSRVYSVKDAAIILGFSTNSIYKFVNNDRLKSTRGNSRKGRFRITHKALEDFTGHPIPQEQIDALLQPQPQPAPNPHPAPSNTSPTPNQIVASHQDQPIPINLTRALIITSLIFILADIFISQNFSLLQQLIRLTLLAIIILITYQFGTAHHDTHPQ